MALRVSTSLRLGKRAHQTIHWRRVCLSLEKEQIQMSHQESHIGPELQQFISRLLPHEEGPSKAGILIPVPGFATFHSMLETQGVEMVPYHLCEEEGWALRVEDLRRALQASRGHCSPRALYIMNPGNPTGYVQSKESIEEVIRFAAEENLFLLADEVYQNNVYAVDREFISYKKVLSEMGPDYSDTVELVSFNSVSKGFMGE
ncbi:hypothetical protein JZ751_000929 [Albula glossodonta]|uniref:alanine transaminase n=1 Tax=Albula glossodonta TaxID=121402 RepID=A0A8T2PXJ5_9TELE|nr:hypothetical protein JZ751_000929 [Albula glossodonta]